MMSSFASLLVAKANATPEKVVPCTHGQLNRYLYFIIGGTYEIDANDQLCPAPIVRISLDAAIRSCVLGRVDGLWCVAVS